jgi:hypothetical protein
MSGRFEMWIYLPKPKNDYGLHVWRARVSEGKGVVAFGVGWWDRTVKWVECRVTHDAEGTRCTCQDKPRGRCVHIQALRAFRMVP